MSMRHASHRAAPAVGLGFRAPIADWTRDNLDRFDVIEVTVDHCLHGGQIGRAHV